MSVLYTFYSKQGQWPMRRTADASVTISWTADKGAPQEASGSSTVPAFMAQSTIWGLETQGYSIDSVEPSSGGLV